MGGYNGRTRMSSVERYDPDSNQWELIASMLKQRSDASAAVLDNKVRICVYITETWKNKREYEKKLFYKFSKRFRFEFLIFISLPYKHVLENFIL